MHPVLGSDEERIAARKALPPHEAAAKADAATRAAAALRRQLPRAGATNGTSDALALAGAGATAAGAGPLGAAALGGAVVAPAHTLSGVADAAMAALEAIGGTSDRGRDTAPQVRARWAGQCGKADRGWAGQGC